MSDRGWAKATRTERLIVDELPMNRKLRLLVDLAHDGLGRPLQVPLLVARGRRPGPCFGVTAALHGNELNGIPVIHRLFENIDCDTLRGTLVAVVAVNVQAVLLHQRELPDGTDLNHIMPGKHDGNVGDVYAFRLVDRIIQQFDRLADLHTASFGRINSLYVRADMDDPVASQMARLLRPQIIVHNPPRDGTLRGRADELGIPAITVEIGDPHRFQRSYIKSTLTGLRRLLADAGMLAKRAAPTPPEYVLCSRSYWLYTDHGGLLEVFPKLTEAVEAGQPIARLRDVFGDIVREYVAPEAGVIVGRSTNPVGQTGSRILHLGIAADEATTASLSHTPPEDAKRSTP